MAHFVFTDPLFLIGTGTDLSDHVTGMVLTYDADAVEDTAGGDTTHLFLGGLKNYTLTVNLAQDLAAGEVDATLFSQVGTAQTVTVRNVKTTGVSATNPNYTASMMLRSYPPIGANIGEKAVTTAEYVAGAALSRATS